MGGCNATIYIIISIIPGPLFPANSNVWLCYLCWPWLPYNVVWDKSINQKNYLPLGWAIPPHRMCSAHPQLISPEMLDVCADKILPIYLWAQSLNPGMC